VLIAVDMLELSKVLEELERQNMMVYSDRQLAINEMVSCVVTMLTAVVDATSTDTDSGVNIPVSVDLVLNWLLNVYDQ
jgi:hypothetical protein